MVLIAIKFLVIALVFVTAFWVCQIRYGNTDDLDQKSFIVRMLQRRKP